MIEFRRYNVATGEEIGRVDAPNLSTSAEFRIFGGCATAKATFSAPFGDPPVLGEGEAVMVYRDTVPVFSGRARTTEPAYGTSVQTVSIEGWWSRVAEREAVTPALLDHITFGPAEGSDHPEITTAYGVLLWILNNRVANDPESLIEMPDQIPEPGQFEPPTRPAKLAGPFMLYAKDDLTKVLEILATMDDCVIGVGSDNRVYYLPRASVTSRELMTVIAVGQPPADWKHSKHGIPEGGGRFVYDRRGPNNLAIFSRSKSDRASVRDYRLTGTPLPAGTSRTAGYRAANIHTGEQARRLARGLFRRFSSFNMKVEELEVRTGTMRFEPHLGRVRVITAGEEILAEDLCGTVSIEFARTTIKASVTLGENAVDPGSGNPVTDPWTDSPGWSDDPQVDTGLGTEEFPDPSGEINFDDGWDGDGDGFHEDGPLTLDYGSDEAAEDNGAPAAGGMKLGIITSNENHPRYSVRTVRPDDTDAEPAPPPVEGEEPSPEWEAENLVDVPAWPTPAPRLSVGQQVLIMYPARDEPFIDGAAGARGLMLRITGSHPGNLYDLELLDPYTAEAIATFQRVVPFPYNTTLSVGQVTFGYWFNGAMNPTPMGGWSCCGGYFQGHDDLGFAGQTITD